MNRRKFMLAGAGLAVTPLVVAAEPYAIEKVILQNIRQMKIGDTIQIEKIGDNVYSLSGDIGKRLK